MSVLVQKPLQSQQKMQQIDVIKIYEKKRCLVVDDLTEVRALYKRMLRSFGVRQLDTAATADQTMDLCRNHNYGMIICDYNLDDSRDGQQILEELRHMQMLQYTTLFIIITAETSREMVLGAIENQPDDYITKPVKPKILMSKVKSLLRRLKSKEASELKTTIGDITINREEYLVTKGDQKIVLPRKEFELLSLLTSKPGKVFKREVILDNVWGSEVVVGGRTIDVHIRKLREKIGDHHFKTIKGVGYKFVLDGAD